MNPTAYTRFKAVNRALFVAVLLLYLAGQLTIGSWQPDEKKLYYNAPADTDFLYYAGIMNRMMHGFPPENPAYGGEPLGQSFVQFYPTAVLALLTGPYVAMRIMNLLYLLIFAGLLRRYFPANWGVGLAAICAGSVGFGLINSLGVDLVARGFNHFPFFIAFTIALFETERPKLRYVAALSLGILHAALGLLAFAYFFGGAVSNRFRKGSGLTAVVSGLGLGIAAILALGAADKPFYFAFVEGFGFSLTNLWMHALPAVVVALLSGQRRVLLLTGIAVFYGAFFHYNPFFPVFMLYYALGWGLIVCADTWRSSVLFRLAAIAAMIGFLFYAYGKYNPEARAYYPHPDHTYRGAREWLAAHSSSDAEIMCLPPEAESFNRLMEIRPLFLGLPAHVAHQGIRWQKRLEIIEKSYTNEKRFTNSAKFIIFGPNEERYFPGFQYAQPPVYRDSLVTIWNMIN